MKATTVFAVLLLFGAGCTSQQDKQLTQQEKDQITKEITAAADGIVAKAEKLDAGWLDYFADSPDWGMVNADGSRWDHQTTMKESAQMLSAMTAWKWSTTRRDFKFLSRDVVLCAWDGKDESTWKTGDRTVYDPHAYTMIFKKINGQWKVIYSQDSGTPVVHKAAKKKNAPLHRRTKPSRP